MQIITKLKELLGYIHWCLLAKNIFLSAISEQCYLENGNYYVVCGSREFLIKTGAPEDLLKALGVPCRKKYVCVKVKSHTKSRVFNAQIMMSTNEGFRYFNIKDKTTIKCFKTEQEAESYSKAIKSFNPFWNTTSIRYTYEYSIEKIISSKSRNQWDLDEIYRVFYDVYERFIVYLESTPKETKDLIIADFIDKDYPDYTFFIQKLFDQIPYLINGETYVFSHCDLHFGNILVDNNSVYLIDFEEARNEVFYYDLFNIIYVEYNDNNNPSLLNDYLSYDSRMIDCFDRAFKAAGVIFIPQRYKSYFKVFLYIRLNNDIRIAKRKYNYEELDNRIHAYILNMNKLLDYINNYSKDEE